MESPEPNRNTESDNSSARRESKVETGLRLSNVKDLAKNMDFGFLGKSRE